MATDIVSGLFGVNPSALQRDRQKAVFDEDYKSVQLSPIQQGNLMLRQGARALGEGLAPLLGGQDPEMAKATMARQLASQFDITTAEGMREYAAALAKNGAPDLAQLAVQRSDQMITAGLTQTKLIAEARKASTERLGTPENQAEQAKFTELLAQYPDTIEGRAKAANDFKEWKSKFAAKVAAAGATVMPGAANIPDLRTAQLTVNDYLGKSKESLSTIKTITNYGEMIKAGNSSQLPQFQRALVKLVGDSQIGQNELKNILGSGGIAADIVDGVTKFMTGAPSNAKIDDVLKGVKVLERQVQESYRAGQDQARRVLTNSKFDPKIVDDLVGPPLKTTPPAGAAKAAAPSTGKGKTVPPLADWLVRAREANPNVSDAELTTYYNKKYPQQKSK